MAASFRNLVLALATASGFCALIPSCADNNESIFIRQFQFAQAPDCTLTSDPTAVAVFGGSVDLAVANSYTAFPLVGNQLQSRGDAKLSKAEPNRVVIEGAQVELKNLDDSAIAGINAFTVIATGTIDPSPSGSTDPVYGVTSVQVIPPALAPALRASLGTIGASTTVKATLKMFGHTLGNRAVESGPVDFPVSICLGCSVKVPTDAVVPDGTRNCKGVLPVSSTTTKTSCFTGQDSATDCRVCQATVAACRPCATDTDCAGLVATVDPKKAATCNITAHFCQ